MPTWTGTSKDRAFGTDVVVVYRWSRIEGLGKHGLGYLTEIWDTPSVKFGVVVRYEAVWTSRVTRLLRSRLMSGTRHHGRAESVVPASAPGKQAFAIPHDDTRLLAVGRDDHDGAALAGSEILLPVFEAGEEHGDERKGEGLPAATADDHPCLVMSLGVDVFASRALS